MSIVASAWRRLVELARELSDESAYARYLKREAMPPSAQAWKAFTDQRHARKYRSAKCC